MWVSSGSYRSPDFTQSWWEWNRAPRKFPDLKLGWDEKTGENEGEENKCSVIGMSI